MKQKYIDFFKQTEESNEHWTEIAISDFTDEIFCLMEEKGINRTELADKIGSSSAYITKVLRGNVNFTLATMTKLARALGTVVRVHLAHKDAVVHWEDERITTDLIIDIQPKFENQGDVIYIAVPEEYPFVMPKAQDNHEINIPRVAHG